jgi:hypothetical protein
MSWDKNAIDFCFTTIPFLIRSSICEHVERFIALQFRPPVRYPQHQKSICNDSKSKKFSRSTCHYYYYYIIIIGWLHLVYVPRITTHTHTHILFGFIWHWHRCEFQTSKEKKIQTDSYFFNKKIRLIRAPTCHILPIIGRDSYCEKQSLSSSHVTRLE